MNGAEHGVIAVTGATGFVGRHFCADLAGRGERVLALVRPGSDRTVLPPSVDCLEIPASAAAMAEAFRAGAVEVIVHFATCFRAGEPEESVRQIMLETNFRFGADLLQAARIAQVKRFLSTATFWQHFGGDDYDPVNFYAATKQAFEDIAAVYWRTGKLDFAVLSLCDTYGPRDTRSKIFNLWNRVSRSGETLKMSPGNQKMSILYIADVVDALRLLLERLRAGELPGGSKFKVEPDICYTLRELAARFEAASGRKLGIEWGALPYREREIMDPVSPDPLLPGWRQQWPVESGLARWLAEEKG